MALIHVLRNALRRRQRSRTLRCYFARQPLTPRLCPLCGASDARLLVRGDRDILGIRTSQCQGCGFVFSTPFYDEHVIDEFYRESYRVLFKGQTDPSALGAPQSYLSERASFYRDWLDRNGLMPGPGGWVLDVGCGEGSLLRAISRARPELRLAGVEPTVAFATHVAAGKGIGVVGDVADLSAGRRFDLVVMVHVLEHVYDPVGLLTRVGERLAAGGALYVDVPDVGAHASINDLHLAHCNHFSAHTLGAALARAGLVAHRVASHRPPTLPPSVYAIAGPVGVSMPGPPSPDPDARRIAERLASIDVSRAARWRWRVQELRQSRRAARVRREAQAND